ncbi:ubiquitin carboxyl-terminal hydrolase 32 [Phlebotomus papatasi]|uniref:ubiquitin carboxyl-terminal hydrolase 32 n=1 Tax=Phlebotomus papatasi TaxID=29031 RepID=UPI0024833ED9|nr:ubiquitin carboxyl-terminal hydrolase 32 [Phlebotomus papatasi]
MERKEGSLPRRVGSVTINPFFNFIREYRRKNYGQSMKIVIAEAAKVWKEMPYEAKNRFRKQSVISVGIQDSLMSFLSSVIFLDGSVPIKYGLRLNSEAKYMELKMELSQICQLDPDLMLCCEILESQVRTILLDDQKVKTSTATELYVYELPKMGAHERSLCNSELGLSIEKGLKDIQRHQGLLASAENYQSTISSTVSSITTSSEDTASGQPLTGGSQASGDNATMEEDSTQPQTATVRKTSAEIERKSSKVSRCLGNTLCMPQTLLCFKVW